MMNYDKLMKGCLAILVAVVITVFFLVVITSDSAEVKSYNWAKSFCGGKDTDISDYRYIIDGRVICKDGRLADVPL